MADKLEELARQEAAELKERAEASARWRAEIDQLARDLPHRFYALAQEIRGHVERFNGATDPQKRFALHESTALAAGEINQTADLNLSFSRAGVEVAVVLATMFRPQLPDAHVIEASGRLRDKRLFLRADPFLKGGKLGFRMWLEGQRLEWPFTELAERLVRTAVLCDLDVLRRVKEKRAR
jgi:hypothetical protein